MRFYSQYSKINFLYITQIDSINVKSKGNFMNSEHNNFDPEVEESSQDTARAPEINNEVTMCLAELSLWKDQCKRISADFENFKKRTEREQARWAEMAKESMLLELVSFVDTFELALAAQTGDKVGIEMIYQALMKLLAKHDVSVLAETVDFDPQFHEAVMQVPSENHQSGQVVQILSKGFMLKDRVLRPAKVSVAI